MNGTSVGTVSNFQYIRLGTEKDGIRNMEYIFGINNGSTLVQSATPGSEYYFAYNWTNVANVFYTMIKISKIIYYIQ